MQNMPIWNYLDLSGRQFAAEYRIWHLLIAIYLLRKRGKRGEKGPTGPQGPIGERLYKTFMFIEMCLKENEIVPF